MGKTPDLKRIVKEDFPEEYRGLIEKIAFPINSFHEQVRNLFNKNIDFTNLNQEIKVLTFTTNENKKPINTLSFNSGLSTRVQGMQVVRIVITSSNTSFAETMPVISWTQNDKLVTINNISNLLPETAYSLTVLTL